MRTLDVSLGHIAPGEVSLTLPFRDDLTQQHGFARSEPHRRAATILVSGALALATVACGDVTGPRYEIALSLYEDTVWATRSVTEVKVSLHVQISNQDSRPVYVTPCTHVLERSQAASWQRIRVSPCPVGRIISLELSPGESTLLTLEYRAPVTDQVWPVVGAAGEYRAVISLTTIPFNTSGITPMLLSLSSRATPNFQIRERTILVSVEGKTIR